MTRKEYMRRLEELLGDLPEHDRQDAIAYYEDYFDEAGPENEAALIQKLGSPEKLAETIRRESKGNGNEQAEYTERGYYDGQEVQKQPPAAKKKMGRKPLPLALVIIILIFGLPVWGGLLSGLLGGLLGIVGAVLGILIALAAIAVAGVVCGVVVIGIGIVEMFLSPVVGVLGIGVGLISLALGLLVLVLFLWIILKAFPALFRLIVNGCQKLLYKIKGGRKNE